MRIVRKLYMATQSTPEIPCERRDVVWVAPDVNCRLKYKTLAEDGTLVEPKFDAIVVAQRGRRLEPRSIDQVVLLIRRSADSCDSPLFMSSPANAGPGQVRLSRLIETILAFYSSDTSVKPLVPVRLSLFPEQLGAPHHHARPGLIPDRASKIS